MGAVVKFGPRSGDGRFLVWRTGWPEASGPLGPLAERIFLFRDVACEFRGLCGIVCLFPDMEGGKRTNFVPRSGDGRFLVWRTGWPEASGPLGPLAERIFLFRDVACEFRGLCVDCLSLPRRGRRGVDCFWSAEKEVARFFPHPNTEDGSCVDVEIEAAEAEVVHVTLHGVLIVRQRCL